MAKILFVNTNLYGHINPTLALTAELVSRGNHVSYICSKEFKEEVVSTGAEFIYYGEKQDFFLTHYIPTDKHPFYTLLEYMLKYDEALLPLLLAHISDKNYDVIICDSFFGAGYFLKQILDIPVVSSHSTFARSTAPVPPRMLVAGTHPQLDECYRVLKAICSKYLIPEPGLDELFIGKGDLNLVYTTKEFNGGIELEEEKYVFTGASIREEETEGTHMGLQYANGKRVIYISLGTLNTNFLNFFKLCIKAFANTEYMIIMSIGKKIEITELGEIPCNFVVQQYVPQLEVLRYASAFISHAGFNSVKEALYYGVPVIAIPMVNDQHLVAKRLVELGTGVALKLVEVTDEVLLNTVNSVVSNADLYAACESMANSFHQTNTSIAVKRIETLCVL